MQYLAYLFETSELGLEVSVRLGVSLQLGFQAGHLQVTHTHTHQHPKNKRRERREGEGREANVAKVRVAMKQNTNTQHTKTGERMNTLP